MVVLISSCVPTIDCRDPSGCWFFSSQEEIGLAVDTSTIDPSRTISLEIQRGINLFIEDHPDFSGHPLKLTLVPVRCYEEKGEQDFSQLTGLANLFVFIGPSCSLSSSDSLHLISDAGIASILPLPVNAGENQGLFRSGHITYSSAVNSTITLLKDHFPGQTIGWIVENTQANREFQQSICADSAPTFNCGFPIYIDQGIRDLEPYLSASLLDETQTWIFLYSVSSFYDLQYLTGILSKKSVVVLSLNDYLPQTENSPLPEYSIISPGDSVIPTLYSRRYEKSYNSQTTLISYQSYLAAQMVISSLEKTVNFFPDGSFLLPRQKLFTELSAQQPNLSGLCIYKISNSQINFSEVECQ